jgi:hypothetical protein
VRFSHCLKIFAAKKLALECVVMEKGVATWRSHMDRASNEVLSQTANVDDIKVAEPMTKINIQFDYKDTNHERSQANNGHPLSLSDYLRVRVRLGGVAER